MEDVGTLRQLTRGLSPIERRVALSVCADVVVMAPQLPGGHPGRAARCGVQLLLDLCLPDLDRRLRDDLAGRARWRSPARPRNPPD